MSFLTPSLSAGLKGTGLCQSRSSPICQGDQDSPSGEASYSGDSALWHIDMITDHNNAQLKKKDIRWTKTKSKFDYKPEQMKALCHTDDIAM